MLHCCFFDGLAKTDSSRFHEAFDLSYQQKNKYQLIDFVKKKKALTMFILFNIAVLVTLLAQEFLILSKF